MKISSSYLMLLTGSVVIFKLQDPDATFYRKGSKSMLIGSVFGAIIGFVIAMLISAPIIWLIGKLALGIEVDGFRPAIVTAFFLALMWVFATLLWNLIGYQPVGGLPGAITHMILNAAFIYALRNSVSGLEVKGWSGAIIAAVAIAATTWLINLGLTAVL